MPSDKKGGRGRSSIVSYRVKAGNREVYASMKKSDCETFMRENGDKIDGVKLRLIPPNKMGKKGH